MRGEVMTAGAFTLGQIFLAIFPLVLLIWLIEYLLGNKCEGCGHRNKRLSENCTDCSIRLSRAPSLAQRLTPSRFNGSSSRIADVVQYVGTALCLISIAMFVLGALSIFVFSSNSGNPGSTSLGLSGVKVLVFAPGLGLLGLVTLGIGSLASGATRQSPRSAIDS